jgi:hypothetical protein
VDRQGTWQIVDRARAAAGAGTGTDAVADALATSLAALPPDEIADADTEIRSLLAESYRWDLWGAAYLLCDGCSDDGFDYFRGWLLLQGRAVWDAALADPDSLAGVTVASGDHPEHEELWYLAAQAYEQATGTPLDIEAAPFPEFGDEEWDFDDDDEMAHRYPNLWARCGGDPS